MRRHLTTSIDSRAGFIRIQDLRDDTGTATGILVALAAIGIGSLAVRASSSYLPQPWDSIIDTAVVVVDIGLALAAIVTAVVSRSGVVSAVAAAISPSGLLLGALPFVPGRLVVEYDAALVEGAGRRLPPAVRIVPAKDRGPVRVVALDGCARSEDEPCRMQIPVARGTYSIALESRLWGAPELSDVKVGLPGQVGVAEGGLRSVSARPGIRGWSSSSTRSRSSSA